MITAAQRDRKAVTCTGEGRNYSFTGLRDAPIQVWADSDQSVVESNELNNVGAAACQVTTPAAVVNTRRLTLERMPSGTPAR